MAQAATPKCLKGCCLSTIITILLIVVFIGVAVAVVLNMTPDKLGIADISMSFLNGKTLRDYGLADVKIKEAFKLLKEIMNPDEDAIVTNRYDESSDGASARDNTANSSVVKQDGSYDYASIVSEKVVYDKAYFKKYNDTTLAYMFDSMISSAETEIEAEGDPDSTGVKFLRELSANVNEVTIKEADGGYTLRIVASISLAPLKQDFEEALKSANIPQSLVKLPDRIYIVSYGTVTADAEGKLVATPVDIRINDVENAVADVLFAVLAENASEAAGESDSEAVDKNNINGEILDAFAEIINNLGRIGVATTDENGEVVAGSERYGAEGLKAHGLTVITYTADEGTAE